MSSAWKVWPPAWRGEKSLPSSSVRVDMEGGKTFEVCGKLRNLS